jgi:uncharacterized protein YaiE (UPF0345 family)
MSEILENVSITQQANVYFDGAVTSRSLELADGRKLTLGFMQAGCYTFNTQAPELMTAIAGEAEVRLAGHAQPIMVRAGMSFEVAGDSSFQITVLAGGFDYSCEFLQPS